MPWDLNSTREDNRFAFGLTTADVMELQTILREDGEEDVSIEEAWSRAAGLLALTQLLLEHTESPGAASDVTQLEHRPT